MSDKIDTQKIAKLARLKLTEIESDKLDGYLEQVVDYIDQLNQLDTSNVQPTSHVLPVNNVFRDDEASKSKNIDYLTEAPSNNKGHYEVPKII
jgi:aspartyl-tRNA(Asn)/glutamyl-tRNA(Gln) amidotransferase subunit C|tara:strand:+ start:50 stop:328 length:279 start_codon:yes stop_codon:yes gene_type:complete